METRINLPTAAQAQRAGYVAVCNRGPTKTLYYEPDLGEHVASAVVVLKQPLDTQADRDALEAAIVAAFPTHLEMIQLAADVPVPLAIPGEETDLSIVGRRHVFVIESRLRCEADRE